MNLITPKLHYAPAKEISKLRKLGHRALDIAYRTDNSLKRFSPLYPHGDIPTPGWEIAATFEGMWQACKAIGLQRPGFVNEAFLKMVQPYDRKQDWKKGEQFFGWRYVKTGELISYEKACILLFELPYLEFIAKKCKEELSLLYAILSETTDSVYVYDSEYVKKEDGYEDPAFVLTRWFNSNDSVSYH